jgi:hypothetical protein
MKVLKENNLDNEALRKTAVIKKLHNGNPCFEMSVKTG